MDNIKTILLSITIIASSVCLMHGILVSNWGEAIFFLLLTHIMHQESLKEGKEKE